MNAKLMEDLMLDLRRDEGLVLKPYKDTVGKLTIGIGRNLDDVGITNEEAYYLLKSDIDKITAEVASAPSLSWYVLLNDCRKKALLNMVFNLGLTRLLGFKNMLKALRLQEWDAAADHAMDSKWAKQVGKRADRIAFAFRHGKDMV